MNANALQRGHDYAFVYRVRRKVQFINGAKRCKVLWVYQLDSDLKQKRTSLVEIQRLNDDGTPDENYPYPDTITAPQIYTTWAEHVIERDRYEEKARKRKEEQEAHYAEIRRRHEERAELSRIAREERQKVENERRERIYVAFDSAGIDRSLVVFTYDGLHINIKTWQLEEVIQNIENTVKRRNQQDHDSRRSSAESRS